MHARPTAKYCNAIWAMQGANMIWNKKVYTQSQKHLHQKPFAACFGIRRTCSPQKVQRSFYLLAL